jgi:hypothetical protein
VLHPAKAGQQPLTLQAEDEPLIFNKGGTAMNSFLFWNGFFLFFRHKQP